ncbi:uncharacterized protein LOC126675466 isoform X2 [Mercurialis annua]|uniref:uncharacterized protein LOC126675466 isoform X2 n=1 Tax=Mercurialis annua TaxID=3986 RepID=UPI0024AE13DB|nr:uncharacterized protein LOC126675466 isoform X2 [Mercurialis annua]
MEEAKAAAYYDELTRKGEGAARFKRGLGFSSNDDDNLAPSRGSALASSTSFLSNFVKSSSDPTQISKYEKEAQLQSIQNKLKKNKLKDEPSYKVSGHGDSHRHRHRSRSRDRDRDRDRHNSRRSRSRSRSRERYKERKSDRRNRSRSPSLQGRRRSEKSSRNGDAAPARDRKETNYSKLIRGYENMTAAEKAKARTKLQLNETAEKDTTKGMGSGWERFEFDKDAPLDDEEIEENRSSLHTKEGTPWNWHEYVFMDQMYPLPLVLAMTEDIVCILHVVFLVMPYGLILFFKNAHSTCECGDYLL